MIADGSGVRHILLLISALLFAPSLAAGMWGSRGVSHAFELDGTRLYVADGRGVSVYDVTDAQQVRRVDVEIGDDESHDVALTGDGRLVLATEYGVETFAIERDGSLRRGERFDATGRVTHIAANAKYVVTGAERAITVLRWVGGVLEHVRTVRPPSAVRDLTFVGDLLYAGFERGGIGIYDPESSERLQLIGIETPSFGLAGKVLWVAARQSGLQAFDVSVPASPQLLSSTGKSEIKADLVAVAGWRAFVVEMPDVIRIYDVSNPSAPVLERTLRDWVQVLAAAPGRLYLSGSVIDGEGLPFASGVPVKIYDTTAALPVFAGEHRDLAGPVSGVFTDGTLAWVVDPPYFRILDVSRTDTPRQLSSIEIPNIQDHVRVRNGLAILYGRSDVNLIDVRDPYAPKYLGEFESHGHPPSAAALLRDTIVEANDHSGLHIIDYSDPGNPVQIAGRIMHYHDVAAGDDAVYAFLQYEWVVLDLTDRNKVVEAKFIPGNFLRIETIPPNSAYPEFLVVSDSNGLQLYGLRRNRFDPDLVAEAPIQRPRVFGTSASAAYLGHEGRLLRLDVTNPTELVETGLRVTSPLQISAAGEKIVVADRYSLRVYGPNTAPPPPPPPTPDPGPARRRAAGRR